jgi:hypothetical protein
MAKVLILFGAGASKSAGVPVMAEFLEQADLLRQTRSGDIKSSAFDIVFELLTDLEILHSKSAVDLQNVESVFNLIEMARLVRRMPDKSEAEIEQASGAIRRLLADTIEWTCKFQVREGKLEPSRAFAKLSNHIASGEVGMRSRKWAFVSLNYDVALDFALHHSKVPYTYALPQTAPKPDAVPILKLHGSLNWTQCECGAVVEAPMGDVLRFPFCQPPSLRESIHFLPISRCLASVRHRDCAFVPKGDPAIVPPSWNKTQYQQTFAAIWSRAAHELSIAENIVIIGYSMPTTDSFFRDLFALGMAGRTRVKRFIVINPDGNMRDQFGQVLGPTVLKKYEFRPHTFEADVDWLQTQDW